VTLRNVRHVVCVWTADVGEYMFAGTTEPPPPSGNYQHPILRTSYILLLLLYGVRDNDIIYIYIQRASAATLPPHPSRRRSYVLGRSPNAPLNYRYYETRTGVRRSRLYKIRWRTRDRPRVFALIDNGRSSRRTAAREFS